MFEILLTCILKSDIKYQSIIECQNIFFPNYDYGEVALKLTIEHFQSTFIDFKFAYKLLSKNSYNQTIFDKI